MGQDVHLLHIYVAGTSARSRFARETLERLCARYLAGRHEIRVFDVLEDPEAAEEASILATPTIVRLHPQPEIRVVGDLSDEQAVLNALDIHNFPRGDDA